MNSCADRVFAGGRAAVKPSSLASLTKNLCGICTRMPAPSPARGSAPTAPRCSRLQRIASASSTIWCDLRPLMSAMKPTPQESLSSADRRGLALPAARDRRCRRAAHANAHATKTLGARRASCRAAGSSRALVSPCYASSRPSIMSPSVTSPAVLSPSFADDPRRPARPVAWSAAPSRCGRRRRRSGSLDGPSRLPRAVSVWPFLFGVHPLPADPLRPMHGACRQLGQQCCPNSP